MSLILTASPNEELVISVGETTFVLRAMLHPRPNHRPHIRYIIDAPKLVKVSRKEITPDKTS